MRILTSFVLLGALAVAPFVLAQSPATWEEHLCDQALELLDDDARRADGLHLILHYTAARPDLDFSRAVGPLLAIFQHDDDPRHRRAAAVALGALDDENGLERLATLVRTERDPQVRATTLCVIDAFVHRLPPSKALALEFHVSHRR